MATVRVRIVILTVWVALSVCPFKCMAHTVVIILGQCTHNVKSKLENELGYATLETNDDVVLGLLRQLKQTAVLHQEGFNIHFGHSRLLCNVY
jgi:hypothetical protein